MVDIKVIVLDFDGVIVESNNIKHQAFSELFQEYPMHYEKIMAYHLAHNHVDRHAKFKYIMENILGQKYNKDLALLWAEKFSEMTRKKIIECPSVRGAMDFLECFSGKYPLYLASATPLDELEIILRGRGLTGYFKEIFGAPMLKKEMFENIMRIEKVDSEDILFIGDSLEDQAVADKFGCKFIALTSGSEFGASNSFNNMLGVTEWFLEKEQITS